MSYKDMEKKKKCKQRYLLKKKTEKYGYDVGDLRGKHGNHLKGCCHPRWNNGKIITSDGYVLTRVGKDYPKSFGNGYVYEHDAVMSKSIGRLLKDNEVIHHINGNKIDNRIENLELTTQAKHLDRYRINGKLVKMPELDGRIWNQIPEAKKC